MVATNYKMKERTRRPPRGEREQEEKREEEVEHLMIIFDIFFCFFLFLINISNIFFSLDQQITTLNSGQEVESSVTMEGRVINARLPRGVVEV